MRVVTMIQDPTVIDKILRHLKGEGIRRAGWALDDRTASKRQLPGRAAGSVQVAGADVSAPESPRGKGT